MHPGLDLAACEAPDRCLVDAAVARKRSDERGAETCKWSPHDVSPLLYCSLVWRPRATGGGNKIGRFLRRMRGQPPQHKRVMGLLCCSLVWRPRATGGGNNSAG